MVVTHSRLYTSAFRTKNLLIGNVRSDGSNHDRGDIDRKERMASALWRIQQRTIAKYMTVLLHDEHEELGVDVSQLR